MNQHWDKIDAEICLAEGGGANRRDGKVRYVGIQTAEKLPYGAKLVSHGPAGHGSRPLQSNAIVHLSRAVDRVASWNPPARLNDTTRYYFERLATISSKEDAARYNSVADASDRRADPGDRQEWRSAGDHRVWGRRGAGCLRDGLGVRSSQLDDDGTH